MQDEQPDQALLAQDILEQYMATDQSKASIVKAMLDYARLRLLEVDTLMEEREALEKRIQRIDRRIEKLSE